MRKVIFLDRDGVINREIGTYVFSIEQFSFNSGLFESLIAWQNNGYSFVVITNQGGIAKGLYSKQEVNQLHQWMLQELNKQGIEILDIYFCPHHHEVYKCLCRKPLHLLIEKAIAKHKIDVKKSFFIGDNPRDIVAAESAKVNGLLIKANSSLSDLSIT